MSTITKIQGYHNDVKQLRVAAYCRVSTDNVEQLEISVSIIRSTLVTIPIGNLPKSTMMKAFLALN